MSESLGAWIKARRVALGLTLRDVERITSGRLSNGYLSQLETGRVAAPSLIKLHALSAALGVDFGELCELALEKSALPCPPAVCPTCGQILPALFPTQDTTHDH